MEILSPLRDIISMAKGKIYKRAAKRSTKRSSRRNKSGSSFFNTKNGTHTRSPFPANKKVKMSYADNKAISVSFGVPIVQSYRMNSLYDPDITGTGTKYQYCDTLLGDYLSDQPYGTYKVTSMMYDFLINNTNSSATTFARMSVTFAESTSEYPTSIEQALMDPNTRVSDPFNILSSGKNTARICGACNLKSIMGKTKFYDEEASAAFNNNPQNPVFANVCIWLLDESANSVSYTLTTRLSGTVILSDRNVCILS